MLSSSEHYTRISESDQVFEYMYVSTNTIFRSDSCLFICTYGSSLDTVKWSYNGPFPNIAYEIGIPLKK